MSSTGTLGPIKNLSRAGANAGVARVGVDPLGNAFSVWTRQVGGDTRVQGRPISVAGAADAIKTLSAGGAGGEAVAVWSHPDDVSSHQRIQASVGP